MVPFGLLLVHKLQGWDDHGKAEEEHKRRKRPQDVGDIRMLLALEGLVDALVAKVGHGSAGKGKGAQVRKGGWSDRGMYSEEFEELTRGRVKEFCGEHPESIEAWRRLGFEVPDAVPQPPGSEVTKEEGAEGRKGRKKKGNKGKTTDAVAPPERIVVESLGMTVVPVSVQVF